MSLGPRPPTPHTTPTQSLRHGHHQTAKAAAVAARDATCLEPLVHFFYLFFFFITLMFFLGLLTVSAVAGARDATRLELLVCFSPFIYLLH